nr:MAG TPA_asm: tail tape measure protein [Caudoviricetes sp.]
MNLLDLFVKITVDNSDVDRGLGETSSRAETLANKLKGGLATAAKVGAAAVAVGGAAIVAVSKQAMAAYADYEQLAGGAELMFGEAYDFIAEKAKNAYSTVQMSQNDYLQQVNGFATGLKTALGGNEQAAAELADRIINAEADVVAATGNSQEAVQNAFNGIMKSNYTMLDNLQIGITPTKEGFQEVIDKVNEWNTANGRATAYQIENFADCQNALVDYIEMVGMQGYAANEAASTIQGSVASMKGAWSNLLVGIADENADFETLTSNFVDSLVAVGANIIPRVNVIIQGLTQLITQASQTIIPLVVQKLLENLPSIIAAGMDLIMALVNGVLDNIDLLVDCVLELIDVIVDKLIENLPKLIDGGIKLTVALANGLIKAVPDLFSKIPQIIYAVVNGLVSGIPDIMEVGKNMVRGVWEGITSMGDWLWSCVKGFFGGIVDGVKNFLGIASPSKVFAGIGGFMAEGLGDGFGEKFASVKKDIEGSMTFDAAEIGLSASTHIGELPGTSSAWGSDRSIHLTVVSPNGKELARFVAPYMGAQLQLVRG